MAVTKGFQHIQFSRLRDLVSYPGLPTQLSEVVYVANASNFRRYLLNRFGNDELDIDQEIATKPDTNMTYRGYCRFLGNDLQYVYPVGKNRSGHAYRRDVKFIAKEMLKRGDVSLVLCFTRPCFLTPSPEKCGGGGKYCCTQDEDS